MLNYHHELFDTKKILQPTKHAEENCLLSLLTRRVGFFIQHLFLLKHLWRGGLIFLLRICIFGVQLNSVEENQWRMQRHIWFSKAVKHNIIAVTMATDQSFVMFPQLDPYIVQPLYYPSSLPIDLAFQPWRPPLFGTPASLSAHFLCLCTLCSVLTCFVFMCFYWQMWIQYGPVGTGPSIFSS